MSNHPSAVQVVLRTDIVDREHVGMVQGAQQASFVSKTFKPTRIGTEGFGKDLDRDGTLQSRVAGAIHFAHSAMEWQQLFRMMANGWLLSTRPTRQIFFDSGRDCGRTNH